jgi:hypothetical protein
MKRRRALVKRYGRSQAELADDRAEASGLTFVEEYLDAHANIAGAAAGALVGALLFGGPGGAVGTAVGGVAGAGASIAFRRARRWQ